MSDIPHETASIVLAKCGRRCCICRRFKPLLLQVHHIVERSRGGGNDLDNLIPICITCHLDVHSRVPFTRRFTPTELKLHRESLYNLVADGSVSQDEEEPAVRYSTDEAIDRDGVPKLMTEAVNLLIEIAQGDGFMLDPSQCEAMDTVYDREYATHKAAFKQLRNLGLLEFNGGSMYTITLDGYNVADVYVALLNEKPK